MKKYFNLIVFTLLMCITSINMYAQESSTKNQSVDRKAQRDAERARQKAQEKAADAISYNEAVKAMQNHKFVLEADQVVFKMGETAYVNSNTNFVLVNVDRGTVQVAFNTSFAGPNGIGGVTVDGNVSSIKMKTNKKGNITYSFSVQGTGISAQVFLTMANGSNQAIVNINPNFNSRTLTLKGEVIPLDQSTIYKGRSW